jgi:hypothetical protein
LVTFELASSGALLPAFLPELQDIYGVMSALSHRSWQAWHVPGEQVRRF